MFENIKLVNQVWLADLCFLTRRYAYSGVSNRKYERNPSRGEWRGKWHKKGLKKYQTFYPKWSKYAFDASQFPKGKRLRQINVIPVYERPVVLFAILDVASRFIIHAHLKHAPREFLSKSFAYPSWFKLDQCLNESFEFQKKLGRFGHPIRFLLDGYVYSKYRGKLRDKAFSLHEVKKDNHYLLSPLDGFFGRLQYEMRKDLTQENLRRYIHYYNYERRHSALKGKTPATLFFDDALDCYFRMI